MEKKIHLTNENLAKKFKSNFLLVSYAIKLAENMIHSGRDARVKADTQNRAMLILEEINQGKDQFDLIETVNRDNGFNADVPAQAIVDDRAQGRRVRFTMDDE